MTPRAARAIARPQASVFPLLPALGLLGLASLLALPGQARGESHEKIIISHGYNEYDELKYSPEDTHLEYVNPDAPTGGEISIAVIGTFDSMNPYATGIGSPGA